MFFPHPSRSRVGVALLFMFPPHVVAVFVSHFDALVSPHPHRASFPIAPILAFLFHFPYLGCRSLYNRPSPPRPRGRKCGRTTLSHARSWCGWLQMWRKRCWWMQASSRHPQAICHRCQPPRCQRWTLPCRCCGRWTPRSCSSVNGAVCGEECACGNARRWGRVG